MKKKFAFLLAVAMIFSLAGCSMTASPKEFKVTENPETVQLGELATPQEIRDCEYAYIQSFDGEYAVFTLGRDIENQRSVGLATETADILVYNTDKQETVMHYPVNLTEGTVDSAYFYKDVLYYSVYYPYTGMRYIYLHDGYEAKEIFSWLGEITWMGESPVYLEMVEDNLFFVHKYETDTSYNKEYYLITDSGYMPFGIGFAAGVPFEHKLVKLESDVPLEEMETKEEAEIDFWIMEKTETERIFTKQIRDHKKVETVLGPSYHYESTDSYHMMEDIIICLNGYSYTRELKRINLINPEDNISGTIGDFSVWGLYSDGEDFVIIRCDSENGYDLVLMDIDDTEITLTKANTGMTIRSIEIADDNAVFLLKNAENENRIYILN